MITILAIAKSITIIKNTINPTISIAYEKPSHLTVKSYVKNHRLQKFIYFVIIPDSLGACGPKSKLLFEGLSEDLQIKRITPKMKIKMAELETAGCEEKFAVKDPGIAIILLPFFLEVVRGASKSNVLYGDKPLHTLVNRFV